MAVIKQATDQGVNCDERVSDESGRPSRMAGGQRRRRVAAREAVGRPAGAVLVRRRIARRVFASRDSRGRWRWAVGDRGHATGRGRAGGHRLRRADWSRRLCADEQPCCRRAQATDCHDDRRGPARRRADRRRSGDRSGLAQSGRQRPAIRQPGRFRGGARRTTGDCHGQSLWFSVDGLHRSDQLTKADRCAAAKGG